MLIEQEIVNNANSLFDVAVLFTPFIGAVFARLLRKVQHVNSEAEIPGVVAQMGKLPVRQFLSNTVNNVSVVGAMADYKLRTTTTPDKKDVTGELVIIPPASKPGAGTILIMGEGQNEFVEGSVTIPIGPAHGPDKPLPIGEKYKDPQGGTKRGINILGLVFYRRGK